jgi:hypothetical protein
MTSYWWELTKRNDKLGSIITGAVWGTNTALPNPFRITILPNLLNVVGMLVLSSCIMAHILGAKKDNAHYLILESMSEESISPGSESKLDEVTVVVDDNSM